MINRSNEEIADIFEKEEIFLINKPKGITSFDCIRILQRIYKEKTGKKIKIGHAGTLDPNATGLMILGINKGTKKLSNLILQNKTYEATILLGKKTHTEDVDGEILEEIGQKMLKHFLSENNITKLQIKKVVESLLGENEYKLPMFSAKKINGKKMYELARKGKDVKIKRKMQVLEISNFSFSFPYIKVNFKVSKGTYIRSLSTKIGEILNIPTTLSDLNRIEIEGFKIENSINLPKENIAEIIKKKSKLKNKIL